MFINEYFKTPIWSEEKPEFVKSLNKASDKYIKAARTRDKKIIKVTKDFGYSHHSTPLTNNKFIMFPSTQMYYITNTQKDSLNFILTITHEFI